MNLKFKGANTKIKVVTKLKGAMITMNIKGATKFKGAKIEI